MLRLPELANKLLVLGDQLLLAAKARRRESRFVVELSTDNRPRTSLSDVFCMGETPSIIYSFNPIFFSLFKSPVSATARSTAFCNPLATASSLNG